MVEKTVLSLPLVFWSRASADLQHSVTAMAVQGDALATGSLTGDIVMWTVRDLQCVPLIFATPRLGVECRQLVFVKPPFEAAMGVSLWVASLHDDGRIRIWDWHDGRCVSVSDSSLLQPIPRVTLMVAIQSRLLAVGGEACVLHIVDSWSLTKVSSYRLPAHLVDVCAQTCAVTTRLVALCGEDQVVLWEFSDTSTFLIDADAPRPINPHPTLRMTMRTSESPRKIALSTDGALLTVAYESIISFIHEDWFTTASRDEAYLCMSCPVISILFTDESLVVVLENGLLVEYNIEEILIKLGVGAEKAVQRKRNNASTVIRLTSADISGVLPLAELSPSLSLKPPKEDESPHSYDLSPNPAVANFICETKCIAFNEDYLFVAKDGFVFVSEVDSISSGSSFHPSTLSLFNYKPKHLSDYQLQCLLEEGETISSSHLVMAHAWPLYIAGTSAGRVFVVPLAAAHAIRCLDTLTCEAVSCLLYYRSSLISCSVEGSVQIWSLSTAELKGSVESDGCPRSSVSSDSGQPVSATPHLPIKTFHVPHSNIKTLKQPHIIHEVLEGLSDLLWIDKWRYWQMLLVGQMEDDTVVLISLEEGGVVCAFYGVKGRLRDAHVNLLFDYLLLNCSAGDCYVFSMASQRLERVLPSTSLPYKSFRRPHASSFQEDPEEATSLPHQLLEYNIIGMTAHHSQALVWVEYPVLGEIQFPVLCLNVGMIVQSFEEMTEFPEQAEFIISMLSCWGKLCGEEELKMQEQLDTFFNIHQPSVTAHVGVFGIESAISFHLPGSSSRWSVSGYISSLLSSSLYSVLSACGRFRSELQPFVNTSMRFHIRRLSEGVKQFQRPSVLVFGVEVLNGNRVAYELLRSSLPHYSTEERVEMMREWLWLYQTSMPFYEPLVASDDFTNPRQSSRPIKRIGFVEALSTVIVCILHMSGGVQLDIISDISVTVLWMLRGSRFNFILAAVLLVRDGIKSWRKTITKELFCEIMVAMLNLNYASSLPIRTLAKKALMSIGKADVQTFSEVLKQEVVKLADRRDYPESVLQVLELFVEKHAPRTLFVLPSFLEVILRSLDPREILLRKICVSRATEALELLVKRLPMVAFEPGHQLIAVGSSFSHILIYDLKTGTMWKDLEGHLGPVSLVEFSPQGDRMVSYSTYGMMLKVWRVEEGFLGLGGLTVEEEQTIALKPVAAAVRSTRELLKTVKAEWGEKSTLRLTREDGETHSYSLV